MAKKFNKTVYCPCCGYITLVFGTTGEMCPICLWECDQEVDDRLTIPSFLNHGLTLNEAKENFEQFGVIKEEFANQTIPFEARKFYKHINDENE